jgi:phage-related protein
MNRQLTSIASEIQPCRGLLKGGFSLAGTKLG